MSCLGIVIIGRNEGERLGRCLDSVSGRVDVVVYVDSGSTDGSVELARRFGVEVVELDMSIPFTAARARNEGFARLRKIESELRYVQFVDGDCVMAEGWLEAAESYLVEHPDVAVVCGHLIEGNRCATIYNRLCHLEWQKTPGEIPAAGGIFMVRATLFTQVGGFDPAVMTAEDDELCLRIRRAGGKMVVPALEYIGACDRRSLCSRMIGRGLFAEAILESATHRDAWSARPKEAIHQREQFLSPCLGWGRAVETALTRTRRSF
ncbi:MAG: glycosyltransferase family A protein [Tepidisphaeraceae bacterium]|jgi:GT2 family glycosyltransferase